VAQAKACGYGSRSFEEVRRDDNIELFFVVTVEDGNGDMFADGRLKKFFEVEDVLLRGEGRGDGFGIGGPGCRKGFGRDGGLRPRNRWQGGIEAREKTGGCGEAEILGVAFCPGSDADDFAAVVDEGAATVAAGDGAGNLELVVAVHGLDLAEEAVGDAEFEALGSADDAGAGADGREVGVELNQRMVRHVQTNQGEIMFLVLVNEAEDGERLATGEAGGDVGGVADDVPGSDGDAIGEGEEGRADEMFVMGIDDLDSHDGRKKLLINLLGLKGLSRGDARKCHSDQKNRFQIHTF
jgi:hypothetical protein